MPILNRASERTPDGYTEENEGLAGGISAGEETGYCRDGTIGERGEKDAEFDEDGTTLMPALRQIHKVGHLVPRAKLAEYANMDIEDLAAGHQSMFNQPIVERKTESDVGTQTSGEGVGVGGAADVGIEDADGDGAKKVGHLLKAAYKLQGQREFQGLPIAIENRAGSVRSGVDKDGHKWRTEMKLDYGYIQGTEGADGEGVDCYVGPNEDADKAYVVHQRDPMTGKYDEDKVMLGMSSKREAKEAFMAHYDDPEKFLGPIDVVSMDRLNELVADKEKLVKISAMLQEVIKLAFDPVTGMGPEPGGPQAGAPAPWQAPPDRLFGNSMQDLKQARSTMNLARKLWQARSLPLIV